MNKIKLARNIYSIFLMLGMALFVFTSCDDDDDGPAPAEKNIVELAQDTQELSTLVSALTAADLAGTFTGTDEFTVFAPTNQAFEDLGTTLDELLKPENQDQLANILKYHVVAGKLLSSNLSNSDLNTLLTGETVTVNTDNGVRINDANVVTPDVEASNGVVHIIDKVLLPPDPTIAEELIRAGADTGDNGLSILLGILTSAGYEDLLNAASNETSTLTVFAPNNAAFNSLLASLGLSLDQLTPDVVRDIIEYHILPIVAKSTDLAAQDYPTLLTNESVTVSLDPVRIDEVDVVQADIETVNGVIHIIDQVLLPSEPTAVAGTVVGIAYFNKDFTTLTAALKKAELVSTLLMDGPYTVFAPTNAAFEAAGITDLDPLSKEALEPILLYHVLGSTVLSTDLSNGAAVPTLNPAEIYISLNDNGAFINGATEITTKDLTASNGVVHVIDLTLTPPANDIVQIAIDAGFSKLAEALTEAGLVATLQGDGPFTVFAPTDAAFDALYSTLGVSGPAEIDDAVLEDVLLYHVLSGRVFSSDLSDGLQATTLSDAEDPSQLTINIGDNVTITDNDDNSADAMVSDTNILGTNGVIHVIDAVILPVTL
ncbi:fasciclin domain-containing protein [Fulvivirgaceae bacterium BMA12]|uniref:Fasciclin domain-containing protein n=1 Tax=Agaribacillus aureus TaxID=3051825 RepID=A0ABT8L3F6_9BACT|nr:fasciclin domain-containing protein [Fulvivirgaceae bacterium BMA12]